VAWAELLMQQSARSEAFEKQESNWLDIVHEGIAKLTPKAALRLD